MCYIYFSYLLDTVNVVSIDISVYAVSGKKCTIEMLNLNASCPNFVHLILKCFVKISQNFI